jgi:hypothetical protein
MVSINVTFASSRKFVKKGVDVNVHVEEAARVCELSGPRELRDLCELRGLRELRELAQKGNQN